MGNKVPEFTKEIIATTIGITVIQALDFLANEINISEEELKKVWSPFFAATVRLVKPADEMVATFQQLAATQKVKEAVNSEIKNPYLEFYEPFNESVQGMLRIVTESVGENSYLDAVKKRGLFEKEKMAAELMSMVNFYFEDQNSKGRKILLTDELFKTIFCTVVPQHVEDTINGNSINGLKNTGQIMQLGQVVFGTALLLQIMRGMLD
jgi:hypothetical protein